MNASEIFLILCLGHLASDFLLQTDAMVKAKKHGVTAYWKHGLIHYVAIVVVTVFADPALLARVRFQQICVALIRADLPADFSSAIRFCSGRSPTPCWASTPTQSTSICIRSRSPDGSGYW
jgi:hypothetical protein